MPPSKRFAGALLFVATTTAFAAAEPEVEQPLPVQEARFPIRGFVVEGNRSITSDRLLQALSGFVGEQQTGAGLAQARETIYTVYRAAGYQMVSVELPTRIDLDGVVRMRVLETTIGDVKTTGNQHFSSEHLRSLLPSLQENSSPNFTELARELFLANDHSSYLLTLAFTPGAPGHADVEIKVIDEAPLHLVLGADNSGTASTGRTRATAALTHGNLWGRGHEGVLGYTTSPQHPGRVQQLAFSYRVTLPSIASRLQVGGSYSNSDVGRVADVFDVAGQGSTLSLRLERDLARTSTARQLLLLEIEDKRTRNVIEFFGTNVGVDVNARPLTIGYVASVRQDASAASLSLAYTRNIPGGARNDDATYTASRSGARANWGAWRGKVELAHQTASHWLWKAHLGGQYTSEPLISSEQFGLGGARSVRGFEEREVTGDRGWRASAELITPPLQGEHRLLAFIDAGGVGRVQRIPGDPPDVSIASYGIGWRWSLGPTLAVSADLARVLRGTATTPAGSDGLHFSVNWRAF